MGLFKEVEGASVVIVEGGVYKATEAFTRDGFLYAKAGAGFVRLYADGSTTKPRCRVDTLHFDHMLFKDALGRLCDGSVSGAKSLEPRARLLLEGRAP